MHVFGVRQVPASSFQLIQIAVQYYLSPFPFRPKKSRHFPAYRVAESGG